MRRPADPMFSWLGPYWEPRDIWVGVYWNVDEVNRFHNEHGRWSKDRRMNLYICLLPCFPIRFRWYTRDVGFAKANPHRSGE